MKAHSNAFSMQLSPKESPDGSNYNINPISSNMSDSSMSSDRLSPTSPYAMSPWSNIVLPAAMSPSKAYTEIQSEGNFYRCITSLLKPDGHVLSLAVADGLLYSASEGKTIRAWKFPDLEEFGRFKSRSGNVKALLIAQDKIFSAHNDQKIRVWRRSRSNPTLHRRVATLPTFKDNFHRFMNPHSSVKHSDLVSSLAYKTGDDLLYSSSWDKTVKVWRMSDFKCIETIKAHSEVVNAVAVGQDGLLFTGSDDCTVKVWRRLPGRSTHTLTTTLHGQYSPVKAVALSPDEWMVYAGSSDGCINYWEKSQTSGQVHHSGILRGHRHAVLCLATVGNLVLSGSADTTIRVWMREMGTGHCCAAVLEGHRGPVKCISPSNTEGGNGSYVIYSGSMDGTIRVWLVCIKCNSDSVALCEADDYFQLRRT
eukprot:Gb_14478 [translate_table: standard]